MNSLHGRSQKGLQAILNINIYIFLLLRWATPNDIGIRVVLTHLLHTTSILWIYCFLVSWWSFSRARVDDAAIYDFWLDEEKESWWYSSVRRGQYQKTGPLTSHQVLSLLLLGYFYDTCFVFFFFFFSSSLGRLLRHIARACPAPVQHQLHLTLKASWNCSPGGSSSSLGGTSAGHPALFYTIPLFSSLFFFNRILVFRSATHTRYTFRSCALASAHHLSIRAPPSPTIIYTGGKS